MIVIPRTRLLPKYVYEGSVGIDWSRPHAQGLLCYVHLTGSAGRDLVTGVELAPQNGAFLKTTSRGYMVDCRGANRGLQGTATANHFTFPQNCGSILAAGRYDGGSSPSTFTRLCGLSYDSSTVSPYDIINIQLGNFFGEWYADVYYNESGAQKATGNVTYKLRDDPEYFNVVGTVAPGRQQLYQGGLRGSLNSQTSNSIGHGTAPQIIFGTYPGQSFNSQCDLKNLMIWNRELDQIEIRDLNFYGPEIVLREARRYFLIATLSDQTVSGTSGIVSGEAFGTGGAVGITLDGSAGIVSAEAHGAGGTVALVGSLVGSLGITTAEAFGTGGDVLPDLGGLYGIVSEEAFGAGGGVFGPVTGLVGIASGETFGADGVVAGPITGTVGIISREAFGAGGLASITGPVTGSTGIVSGETFGAGGSVYYLLAGSAGIASALAFGSGGDVRVGLNGYVGIPSGEAFGAGGLVSFEATFALYISQRDRVSQLMTDSMQITYDLTSAAQASFALYDASGRHVPRVGEEVVYTYGGKRIFGGKVIKTVVKLYEGTRKTRVEVQCAGYDKILADRVYTKTWTGPTLDFKTIMLDIVAVGLAGENLTLPPDMETSTISAKRLEFAGDTVQQCFDRMKSAFGYNIWVDMNRVIRAERGRWQIAPYTLRDQTTPNGLTTGVWSNIQITRDGSQYRNVQGARTAIPVAGQQTSTFVGNGVTRLWRLTQPTKGKPSVKVNGTAQAVVENADRGTTPYDFYYFNNEAAIYQNGSAALLTGSDTIEVVYPAANLDVCITENSAAIALHAAVSGDSGIVQANTPARNIRDRDSALALNASQLAKYGARSITEVQFISRRPYWEVGQVAHAFLTAPHLGGWFQIKALAIREIGTRFLEYTVTMQAPTPPEITSINVVDNGDGTFGVTIDTGVNTGLNPGETFTLTGLGPGGTDTGPGGTGTGFTPEGIHILSIAVTPNGSDWTLVFTVDDWPGTLPGEGVQISGCKIDATGGMGLSYGQPVLRINGAWNVHLADRTAKTITVRTGLDGNPVVDFSGFRYTNPPDGLLSGADSFGSLNGSWTATGSSGTEVTFTTGQVCNIVSVALTAGADPDSWTVRCNLDQIPQATAGDSMSVDGETHHMTTHPAPNDQSDRASRRRYAEAHGINGFWYIDTVPASPAQYITFKTNDGNNSKLDLTSYVYDGNGQARFTASNGNAATNLTGYTGTNTIDPVGTIFTGQPALPFTPEGQTNPTSKAGTPIHRIIAVNNATAEVTTADPHGFTTNYPVAHQDEVCIFGCTNPEHINIAFTRVTVTSPTTFIAEDVDTFQLAFDLIFVNDGHGGCFNTRMSMNVASGPTDIVATLHGVMAGNSSTAEKAATFILANSVPGLPSRPLQAGANQTNAVIYGRDIGVVDSLTAVVGTPSDGADIQIDVKQNGVSILPTGQYLTIPQGSSEVVRVTEFANNPQVVQQDDKFTVDVVQTGAAGGGFPGCNAVVNMYTRS